MKEKEIVGRMIIVTTMLAACAENISPTQPGVDESVTLPPPGLATEEESPTESETDIAPTPTVFATQEAGTGAFCNIDAKQVLLNVEAEELDNHKTVPVLTEGGLEEVFGVDNKDKVLPGLTSAVADTVLNIADSLHGEIDRVTISGFIRKQDILDAAQARFGSEELPFELDRYQKGQAIEGKLVSIDAAKGGWTVSIWDDASIGTNAQGSAQVNGTLLSFEEDEQGELNLMTIPAQFVNDSKAEIFIVDGCMPEVARVGADGKVNAIFNDEVNLITQVNEVWTGYAAGGAEEIQRTPTEVAQVEEPENEWTTIMNEEDVPVEVIDSLSGETIKVRKGAFEWQDSFIIWDEQEKDWMEPEPIYTMGELVSQAPTKEEMVEFLKSDEVVRATHHSSGNDIPLGVGNKYEFPNFFSLMVRDLEVIIWDSPKLAYVNIPDESEPLLVELLPAVITGGSDNLDNPSYVLISLGKERFAPITFAPQPTEKRNDPPTGSGTHYLYELRFEDMQEPFIPGRQMGLRVMCGFNDNAQEQEYRDFTSGEGGLAIIRRNILKFHDSYGPSMEASLADLMGGGSVESGSWIGNISNIILTATENPSGLNIIADYDEFIGEE